MARQKWLLSQSQVLEKCRSYQKAWIKTQRAWIKTNMTQIIISISGRKGAGKNTIATFISHYFACRQCPHPSLEASERYAPSVDFIEKNVGFYSFADTLKDFCIETLGLLPEQCYGTDDQKNSFTPYQWEDVADVYLRWKFADCKWDPGQGLWNWGSHMRPPDASSSRERFYKYMSLRHKPIVKTGPMTGREIMQLFGTDLIRYTFGNVWAEATLRRIKKESKPLALITDNRFPNEVEAILKHKGHIIRLTRTPFGHADSHPSEASLDDYDWNRSNCYILDNQKMTENEQNICIIPILGKIGLNQQMESVSNLE